MGNLPLKIPVFLFRIGFIIPRGVSMVPLPVDKHTNRIVRELDQIAAASGYPLKLRIDNGSELIALALADWAE